MKHDDSPVQNRDDRLAEVILKYIENAEAGTAMDREEFMNRHYEFRSELEQFLANRDQVERMVAPLRSAMSLAWDMSLDRDLPRRADFSSTATPAEVSDEQRPLGQLGEFRLLREIGRGGMGIVYEAQQQSLQRRVALKVLPFAAAIDAKHVLRFKNEALAAGMLNHPHIVPVYSVGNERGVYFYAMQFVDGQSLGALIVELREHSQAEISADQRLIEPSAEYVSDRATDSLFSRELSTQHSQRGNGFYRTAGRLMLQAAEALQHAHESGIIHRDIKPANLLVDVCGQLHITDFGLAQIRSEVGLTRTGDTPGTLRYMSPEQAAGRRAIVDHRTDIYSLGATFYELLTLTPIFAGHDVQELLSQVFDTQPQPLRKLDKSIPVELEIIVLKATNKSPDDRYHTAVELAADLQRYLDNQPILARRPSLFDRARKWARRHPSAVVAGLAFMLVVSAISLAAFVLVDGAYHRERLRADEAEAQFQLARRSVDELVRVSEEELAYNAAAEPLRRRLLTSVLAFYQEFIEQRRGDPRAQVGLTEARQRVESILKGLRALRAAGQIKLLSQTPVSAELRLSEGQRATAQALLNGVEELWHETFRDIGKISAAELHRRFVEQSQLNEAELKAMLSADQWRRLYQLDLQVDVAAALREPEVLAKIRLTDEQRDRIKTIEQQETAFWRGAHPRESSSNGSQKNLTRTPKLSKNDRILEVLTMEQAVSWRELTGTPLPDLRR